MFKFVFHFVKCSYHLSFSLICLSLSLVISSFISSRLSLCLCNSVFWACSFSFSWFRFSICSLSSERTFSSCCFSELVRPRAFFTRSRSRVVSSRSRLLEVQFIIESILKCFEHFYRAFYNSMYLSHIKPMGE